MAPSGAGTSEAIPKPTKSNKKKCIKRTMLCNPDREFPLVDLDEKTNDGVLNTVCEYLEQFNDKKALQDKFLLGFNSISRKIEDKDPSLRAVLLNSQVEAQILLDRLNDLCRANGVAVACLQGFHRIPTILSKFIKGLRTNIVGIAVMGACDEAVLNRIRDSIPVQPSPVVTMPRAKKRRLFHCAPEIEEGKLLILKSDLPDEDGSVGESTSGLASFLSLAEGTIPIVNFDTFIGSDAPIEKDKPVTLSTTPTTYPYKELKLQKR